MRVYDYTPYGEVEVLSETVGAESDRLYTGHFYHRPSELHLTLYRAYAPELGRWLSRDPIEEMGGLNLYVYVRNSPIALIDKHGLTPYGWGRGAVWGSNTYKPVFPRSPYPEEGPGLPSEGWYRHCVNTCRLRRHIGLYDPFGYLVTEIGAEAHGGDLPWQRRDGDPAGHESDLRGNQAGHEAAWESGSCEDNCKKKHPSNPANPPNSCDKK